MQLKLELFSNCPPGLPDGRIITSSLLKALYSLREYDWKFIEAVLKVDPGQRPTAKNYFATHGWNSLSILPSETIVPQNPSGSISAYCEYSKGVEFFP